jgi:hypothetical protein
MHRNSDAKSIEERYQEMPYLFFNFKVWLVFMDPLLNCSLHKVKAVRCIHIVERLYCKRSILCLASSKIMTPLPLTARRVCTPAFGAGGGHTRWVERGWGVNILEDARHSSVLYIFKYFVIHTHSDICTHICTVPWNPSPFQHPSADAHTEPVCR